MSATQVFLRDRPSRAIALATPTHVLVFRHATPGHLSAVANASKESLNSIHGEYASSTGNLQTSHHNGRPKSIVELLQKDKADLNGYRIISKHNVHGTLGLITVDNDVFLCVVSQANKVATVRPGESVQKIGSVDFHCVTTSEYDHILHENVNVYPTDMLDEEGFDRDLNSQRNTSTIDHPCMALRKLLSGGSFYYSADFDITSRLQARSTDSSSFDFDSFDQGYLWNSYMIKPLIDFRSRLSDQERQALDSTRLLTSAIRGFVNTVPISPHTSPARAAPAGLPSTLTLISRLSCRRAGTRFNARGIDDDGAVANYVESETVFWSPSGVCFSYVQIRGSVPLFWEQSPGFIPGQQKIQITRSMQATQPAFDKHFEDLELKYGPIHVVNLLSGKSGEAELSKRYHDHVIHCSLNSRLEGSESASSEHCFIRETDYDFHEKTRLSGYEAAMGINDYIGDSANSFGYCLIETSPDQSEGGGGEDFFRGKALHRPAIALQQEGVFRTNCLDCLDRTNLVQTIISQTAIDKFLARRSERPTSDFLSKHSALWADNGDALSRIYAGTGALKSSFTRHGKMSIAGALADVRKSATRMYINNFADNDRQTVMDMLLGRLIGQTPAYLYDPINDYVMSELSKRCGEYSSTRDIKIWAGTYNLNGRSKGLQADLSPWLCPSLEQSQPNPEIVAVGFQEIVELNPQHIMSTDPARRQAWERAVQQTLNENARNRGSEKYVLLRGGQLVGASLSIFVKVDILPHIKNVEGSLKKTGMSGMAGNKGAVAIRMDIDNTSLCFVTAHLAAGFANYEERNRDYKTINHGLRFQRNRGIEDHDTIIWMGDFNYRIGLNDEEARRLVKAGDIGRLYENDQLNLQMVAGLTFPHYSEARIKFNPTYKYDVGTDDYDTSEKSRIPAWTDRILRKGHNLRQLSYSIAPLRFSDHRPVYATFLCKISTVDENIKHIMSREIYNHRKSAMASSANNSGIEDSDDDLIGFESVEAGLPPASSDRRKWWLDNGLPARSQVAAPSERHMPNPNRPSNPFSVTNQPDWVSNRTKSQASTTLPTDSLSLQSESFVVPSSLPAPLQPTRSSDRGSAAAATIPSSTASTASSPTTVISRKPAPPIPKKPGSLSGASVAGGSSNPNSPSTSPIMRTSDFSSSSAKFSAPMRQQSSSPALPPLKPTRPSASIGQAGPASYRTSSVRKAPQPQLPQRPKPASTTADLHDLLSGDLYTQQAPAAPKAVKASNEEEEQAPRLPPRKPAGNVGTNANGKLSSGSIRNRNGNGNGNSSGGASGTTTALLDMDMDMMSSTTTAATSSSSTSSAATGGAGKTKTSNDLLSGWAPLQPSNR